MTVTVTDAEGLTASASATVTVTDDNGTYASVLPTLNFRGTPNAWGSLCHDADRRQSVGSPGHLRRSDQPALQVRRQGDWTQNYGDTNKDGVAELTGSDILTPVIGQYRVRFNDQTLQYSLTPVSVTYAKNVASLNIRGTTNNWGTTPCPWSGITSGRPASPSPAAVMERQPALQVRRQGDWTQNYGDTNKDGVAELAGADITTAVVGAYVVRFNDQTLAYSLSAQ